MAKNKCPYCGSTGFFVKDPEDQYETHEFQFQEGKIVFKDPAEVSAPPELGADTETFCQKCTWRGTLKTISPS